MKLSQRSRIGNNEPKWFSLYALTSNAITLRQQQFGEEKNNNNNTRAMSSPKRWRCRRLMSSNVEMNDLQCKAAVGASLALHANICTYTHTSPHSYMHTFNATRHLLPLFDF